MPKLGRNKICLCGSGKKYKYCCLDKNFTFVDKERSTTKVPLNSKATDLLNTQVAIFKRHFERKPTEEDPVFLMKYLYSDEDVEQQKVSAMESAKVDPAIIYAYKKTGHILTENELDNYTEQTIDAWNAAIDEFSVNNSPPESSHERHIFDKALDLLSNEFESYIYVLGLANDKFFNLDITESNSTSSKRVLTTGQYQAFCASKVHRTLRTIRLLIENKFSDDILKLARTIYESYLHIVAVQSDPNIVETLVDGPIGIKSGTHCYKKNKNGKYDKRIFIETSTGREFPSYISTYKMATLSPYREDVPFFDLFYVTTSQMIHPSVFSLNSYVSSSGLDPTKSHMHEESIVFTALATLMVIDSISKINNCPNQVAADCRTIIKRSKTLLLTILDTLNLWESRFGTSTDDLKILKSRCLRL